MIRLYIGMLQILGIFLLNFFFSGEVTTNIEVPAQINAGKEMKVSITIKKGDLQGFSRFQMELPAGLTATNVYSANADFSFKDQKVRLIWLRLPDEPTITFSFNIQCYETLKGNFDLNGRFSFIDDNERKSIDIQPQSVAIVPSPSIDPGLLVDIRDFGKMSLPQAGSAEGQIACIREKPVWSPVNKEYVVTLLLNKENLQKFAKIEENIPAGFTAVKIDSKEGIFTFRDNKIKFLWMNMNSDPYFTVSYKLIPAKVSGTNTIPSIAGAFSYMVDDKTKSIPIVEKDVSLANLTPEKVKSILSEPTFLASNTQTSGSTVLPDLAAANQNIPVEKSKDPSGTDLAQNTKQESGKQSVVNTTKTNPTANTSDTEMNTADVLNAPTGIYYRVQIAAGHKPINVKSYFRKYKLENTVVKENHDGWIKYSVGSFDFYKDAHDYRIHIWNTTSIADAFVAAYNSGKRITVQEALMVANQRWYK